MKVFLLCAYFHLIVGIHCSPVERKDPNCPTKFSPAAQNDLLNFPKVEMNLLYSKDKDYQISQQAIEVNKSLITIEMRCSFKTPITWEFNFDPYVYHWTDSIWFLAERSVQDFYDTSSYTYKAILNLRLHNPPVPQNLTCQTISDSCRQGTVVSADYSDSANESIRFETKSSTMYSPNVDITSECGVVYTIKQIQAAKIQWKCAGADETPVTMKYRQSWYCTTASQCYNYYNKAKGKPTCTRILKEDEECSGCLTSSDVSTMIMFCKIDPDHWVQPLFYSVDSASAIPKFYLHSDNSVLQEMVIIGQIPPVLYPGDELKIVCTVSEYLFAAPAIFALKYSNSQRLKIINGETNFTFVSGTVQTYANFYQDEFNGEYDLSRNVRTYTYTINITQENTQLERVYCFAPIWNTTGWINKSAIVKINRGQRPNGCKLKELGAPKLIILPGTVAVYSTQSLLVAKKDEKVIAYFNCSSLYPIKWSFSFGDDYRKNISVKLEKTETNLFRSVLRLEFNRIPLNSRISCEILGNKCLRSTVRVSNNMPGDNLIKFFTIPYTDPPKAADVNNDCFTQLIVKIKDDYLIEWKSVDYNHQEEKMNAVSQIYCDSFVSCQPFYSGETQMSPNCLKVLTANENCVDCDTFPRPASLRFSAGYMKAEHRSRVALQPFFHSLTSSSGGRKIYFNWENVNPQDMIQFHQIQKVFYTGQVLKLTCSISPYYFARGFRFALQFGEFGNQSILRVNDSESNTIYDQLNGIYKLSIALKLNSDHLLLRSITCVAPPQMSMKWIATPAQNISVYKSSLPKFKISSNSVTFYKGDSEKTVTCEAEGVPEPKVEWKLSAQKNDEGFMQQQRGKISVLMLPSLDITHSGTYICVATNVAGSSENVFHVDVQEGQSVTTIIVVISVVILLLFILGFIALLYVKFWNIQRAIEILTEEDIKAFREGGSFILFTNVENDNGPIYSSAFDTLYEIPSSKFVIDRNRFLGGGAYGSVYLGKYTVNGKTSSVAVKTVDPAVDMMYFKALLSEVKVMAYMGNHEHILLFIGASTENIKNKEIYILTELCPNGNLQNFLQENRLSFNFSNQDFVSEKKMTTNLSANMFYDNVSKEVASQAYENVFKEYNICHLNTWAYQIARGMEYLERKKVIHGDLATRNILLTGENIAKISDFGLSKQLVDYATYVKTTNCPLPWRWMALESLKDMKFSIQTDVWSFGITMWEIYTLAEVPYPGWSLTNEFVENLTNGLRLSKPAPCSQNQYNIMTSCWDVIPAQRPSFQDIVEHLQNFKHS